MQLIAANTGSDAFRFEEALHTYFRVGDVEQARLRGLESVSYLDNTDENREKKQNGPVILSAPTDNAYLGTQSAVDVVDPVLRRVIRTEKENSTTTIVWNPWQLGAVKLSDLGDEDWHQMICVEGSNILNSAISLQPGEQHSMSVTLSVVAD
jgi:D-hexose-6-phosphate mutarotase